MNERQVVKDFRTMCEKSINPDLYSSLVDEIIPALWLSRGVPEPDGLCEKCGGYGFVQEKCAGGSKVDHPCPDCHSKSPAGSPKPKMGMYGETPVITVGNFEIREFTDPPGGSVWMEDVGEDGMQFPKTLFLPALKAFYDANF